jgi:hypothetical protein
MKQLLLLTAICVLASCSALDERVQRVQDQTCSVTSILTGCTILEDVIVRHQEKCSVMGFVENTPEMANCVLQLEKQRLAPSPSSRPVIVYD